MSMRVRVAIGWLPAGGGTDLALNPQATLKQGHSGAFGPGMHARAKQISAKLSIWSRAGAGTEVDLTISGSIAYGSGGGSRPGHLSRRTG